MHELSLISNIISIITDTAREHNLSKVTRIRLVIGEMRQVEPEALQWAFHAAAAGSVCENAELAIEWRKVKIKCHKCSKESELDEYICRCPRCGDSDVEITNGREFTVSGLEGD